jgi:DNA-binding NarL/FixJ family response regulator
VIRALIVDDHPAVLGGLVSALRSEPGLVPLATATGVSGALNEAERRAPNVALIDYRLADGDGLVLCHALKLLASPPAVLIYSAFARWELALAAKVAGADGMVDKGAPLDELFDAIRTVARGGKALPALRPEAVERSVMRLDPEDLPILGMRIDGATLAEIASVLQLEERELSRRLAAMLGRLAGPVATPGRRG